MTPSTLRRPPRLLARLETDLIPTYRAPGRPQMRALLRQGAMGTPEIPASLLRAVRIPSWDWTYTGADMSDTVTLDANAAYISAASTVDAALGALDHTGALTRYTGLPGYYLVSVERDTWADRRIVSPLGGRSQAWHGMAWLAQPTVQLLSELVHRDMWPEIRIHDSWTHPQKVRLSKWTNHIRDERIRFLDSGDAESLDDLKNSYVQAVQMIRGHAKCKTRRPDWYHAIHAAHRANVWRKAWRCAEQGFGPVRMGSVDELEFGRDDLVPVQQFVKIDQTKKSLGSFKIAHASKGEGDPEDIATAPVREDVAE